MLKYVLISLSLIDVFLFGILWIIGSFVLGTSHPSVSEGTVDGFGFASLFGILIFMVSMIFFRT